MEENATCRFPEWTQGDWQYFSVRGDDMMMANSKEVRLPGVDGNGFESSKRQQFLCLGRDVKVAGQEEKILMYSQTIW